MNTRAVLEGLIHQERVKLLRLRKIVSETDSPLVLRIAKRLEEASNSNIAAYNQALEALTQEPRQFSPVY